MVSRRQSSKRSAAQAEAESTNEPASKKKSVRAKKAEDNSEVQGNDNIPKVTVKTEPSEETLPSSNGSTKRGRPKRNGQQNGSVAASEPSTSKGVRTSQRQRKPVISAAVIKEEESEEDEPKPKAKKSKKAVVKEEHLDEESDSEAKKSKSQKSASKSKSKGKTKEKPPPKTGTVFRFFFFFNSSLTFHSAQC